jgi:hypothetical protein
MTTKNARAVATLAMPAKSSMQYVVFRQRRARVSAQMLLSIANNNDRTAVITLWNDGAKFWISEAAAATKKGAAKSTKKKAKKKGCAKCEDGAGIICPDCFYGSEGKQPKITRTHDP